MSIFSAIVPTVVPLSRLGRPPGVPAAELLRQTGLTLVIDKLKSKSDARAVLKLN
jgi:hypothetical protein